jgi:large subunit ribosomal protein L21
MYAVIETGGKQYRVEVGTELEVELLDAEPGKTVTLNRVLLVADGEESTIGRPVVADASVSAEVVSQTRGPKLIAFKYRPKARRRVKKGHRQELTLLRVADITIGGKSAAKDAKKAEAAARTERQRLEEAAVAQAAKDAELAAKLEVGAEAPAPKKSTPAKAEAAETAEKPAKAEKAGKAEPAAKTDTESTEKPATKTTKAKTETKADAAAEPEAKATAPKRSAKAADTDTADATDADGDAAPKRSRTTKKDE